MKFTTISLLVVLVSFASAAPTPQRASFSRGAKGLTTRPDFIADDDISEDDFRGAPSLTTPTESEVEPEAEVTPGADAEVELEPIFTGFTNSRVDTNDFSQD
jgi:hypothetical protein